MTILALAPEFRGRRLSEVAAARADYATRLEVVRHIREALSKASDDELHAEGDRLD